MRPLTADREARPAPNPPARREPLIRLKRRDGRRGAQRTWYRRPSLIAGAAGAVLLIGTGAVAWLSGWAADLAAEMGRSARQATVTAGFAIAHVNVVGRESTPRDELLAAIGVGRGDPILFFDVDEARAKIERISWVRAAAVRRMLPDTVLIELSERVPAARWQIDGQTLLIDREGKLLRGPDISAYQHLKRVVGPGAADKAGELFDLLAVEPQLFARVKDAVRVRGRRWDLAFDNGVIVMLPEEGADFAWRHLATLDREKGLLSKAIVAVDLRLPEKLVVKMLSDSVPQPPAAPAPPRKAGGKNA
ncbi:cell division protein FtsQ/DivIB [Desertibaculum subflavum]|uniref:cell division protein FtsQ/DivIB n=1 Tax=Desertibaculum subflavum TaxID=2268458 RepID=UPI0013C49CC5